MFAVTPSPITVPTIFDENDWNDISVQEVRYKGRDADPFSKHFASKILAEKAAFDMYEKYKNVGTWDLVVLLPSKAVGPPLQPVSTPDTLNASMNEWYQVVFGGVKSGMSGYVLPVDYVSYLEFFNS